MSLRLPSFVCAAGAALALAAACTPPGDAGECDTNRPCTARGEVCDTSAKICVEAEVDLDQTAEPDADGAFGPLALPFFRGEVCVAKAAQPGQFIPVSISPCVHPCVTATKFVKYNMFTCTGSSCEGANLVWLADAVGAACPADVFGRFDAGLCTYPYTVEGGQGPIVLSGKALVGQIAIEAPFLSNEDMATIAGKVDAKAPSSEIWPILKAYPESAERVFTVTLNDANDPAPASCTGADKALCECRLIGL